MLTHPAIALALPEASGRGGESEGWRHAIEELVGSDSLRSMVRHLQNVRLESHATTGQVGSHRLVEVPREEGLRVTVGEAQDHARVVHVRGADRGVEAVECVEDFEAGLAAVIEHIPRVHRLDRDTPATTAVEHGLDVCEVTTPGTLPVADRADRLVHQELAYAYPLVQERGESTVVVFVGVADEDLVDVPDAAPSQQAGKVARHVGGVHEEDLSVWHLEDVCVRLGQARVDVQHRPYRLARVARDTRRPGRGDPGHAHESQGEEHPTLGGAAGTPFPLLVT